MSRKLTIDLDEYGAKETAERRDKVLSVMLHTPPKPHVPKAKSRVGKAAKRIDLVVSEKDA